MWAGKVLGALMVFVSCLAIGWYTAERIRMRTQELRELERALLLLKGDIRYAKTALPEAIGKLARYHEGSFTEFFRSVSEAMLEYSGISLTEIWRGQARELLKKTSLNAGDRELVAGLGDVLGVTDAMLQQNTLDLAIVRIREEIEAASEKEKEKVYLCRALGVLGGLFLTILLL